MGRPKGSKNKSAVAKTKIENKKAAVNNTTNVVNSDGIYKALSKKVNNITTTIDLTNQIFGKWTVLYKTNKQNKR